MVPVERIELPTFGLQNRCSTAELNRRIKGIGRSNIRLAGKGPEPQTRPTQPKTREKAALRTAFPPLDWFCLLAGVLPAIFAAEPGTGGADEAVQPCIGRPANRGGGGADRPFSHACGGVGRPEAGTVAVQAVIALVPSAMVAVRAASSRVQAIAVCVELRTVAGALDHCLCHGGACQCGGQDRGGREKS